MPTWFWKFLINSEEITEKEKNQLLTYIAMRARILFLMKLKRRKFCLLWRIH